MSLPGWLIFLCGKFLFLHCQFEEGQRCLCAAGWRLFLGNSFQPDHRLLWVSAGCFGVVLTSLTHLQKRKLYTVLTITFTVYYINTLDEYLFLTNTQSQQHMYNIQNLFLDSNVNYGVTFGTPSNITEQSTYCVLGLVRGEKANMSPLYGGKQKARGKSHGSVSCILFSFLFLTSSLLHVLSLHPSHPSALLSSLAPSLASLLRTPPPPSPPHSIH